MLALRRPRVIRWIVSILVASILPAVAVPAAGGRECPSRRVYAQWLRERVPAGASPVVEAVLRQAGVAPTLEVFVGRVVDRLVEEEGVSYASMALTGRLFDEPADIVRFLVRAGHTLSPGTLPSGAQTLRTEVPRAVDQRLGHPSGVTARLVGAAGPVDTTAGAFEDPVRPAPDPGRGHAQPLGP